MVVLNSGVVLHTSLCSWDHDIPIKGDILISGVSLIERFHCSVEILGMGQLKIKAS